MSCAEPRSTVCAEPRNGSPAWVRICAGSRVGVNGGDGGAASGPGGRVGAERARLHGDEAGAVARVAISAVEAALHELTGENRAVADGHYVADEHLAQARGQRGREVAHLVGMREQDVSGRLRLDELFEGGRVAVGRVRAEERMLQADDFAGVAGCGFGGQGFGLRANYYCGDGLAESCAQGLRRG